MNLYLLEPAEPGEHWAPFSGVRPIAELRVGAFLVRERWERLLNANLVGVISPATPRFADVGSAPLVTAASIVGPAVVARSAFAPIGNDVVIPPGVKALTCGGATVAWVLGPGAAWNGPKVAHDGFEVQGMALEQTADLVTACERLLEGDCVTFLDHAAGGAVPAGCVVLGDPAALAVAGATVEPMVVFDVRKGPIILEPGSIARAGTRLEGPLYVGPHSWLLGGAIRSSSIGPHCRVHGELATSVLIGYANKAHDGFVGHSVLGHWANLGAGTITSNLKNTYGQIRLELPNGRWETGRSFLGSLIGDHAKTGIGTLLSTGTVICAGANVLAGKLPRFVEPFLWNKSERLTLDGFLTIARRVMPRRGVQVTADIEASLASLHARFVQ